MSELQQQSPPTLQEFQWFEQETKVRLLVFQLLEPHLKESLEQRKQQEILGQKLEQYAENYDEFKQIYFQSGKGTSLLQQLQLGLGELRSKQAENNREVFQDIKELQHKIEGLKFNQQNELQELNLLKQKLEFNDDLLRKYNEQSLEFKKALVENLDQVSTDNKSHFIQLQENIHSIKVKQENQDTQLRDHKIKIQHNQERFNILQDHFIGSQTAIKKIDSQLECFHRDLQRIDDVIANDQRVKNQLEMMDCKLNNFENYIEKYLPLFLQGCISDTLHNCLKEDEKYKLADYEEIRFTELHRTILEDDGQPRLDQRINEYGQLIERTQKRNMQLVREKQLQKVVHIPKEISSRPMEQSSSCSHSSDSSEIVGIKGEEFKLDRHEMESYLDCKFQQFKNEFQGIIEIIQKSTQHSDQCLELLQEQMIKQLELLKQQQFEQVKILSLNLEEIQMNYGKLPKYINEISEIQYQQQNSFQKLLQYSLLQSQFNLQEISYNGQNYNQSQAIDIASKLLHQLKFELSQQQFQHKQTCNPQFLSTESGEDEMKRSIRIRTSQTNMKRNGSQKNEKSDKQKLYLLGSQIQQELNKSFEKRTTNVKLLYQHRKQ